MINKMNVEGNIYGAGVYVLETKSTGVVLYCGSAIQINDALSRHLFNCKRGNYMDNNKRPIQEAFDRDDLVFKVIHESVHNGEINKMSIEEKEALQKALSVLETTYIETFKDTICNKQMSVTKHTTSPTKETTLKRRQANLGENNPNCRYDEGLVQNVIWLKDNGYSAKEIIQILLEHDIEMNRNYVYSIGQTKWKHLKGVKPEFVESEVI